MVFEIILILSLIMIGGVFAMAEIALVSVRRSRLEQLTEEGNPHAKIALEITSSPQKFLSAVQCGMTLISTFAGAIGGATLAEDLVDFVKHLPFHVPYAESISFGVVVILISYITLVLGELVPKSVALAHAEVIALFFARPMGAFMKVAYPFIHVLSASTSFCLSAIGVKGKAVHELTQDEIEFVLEQGAESGALGETEHEMVEGVFRLGDRLISLLMTPRKDVVWIDVNDPAAVSLSKVEESLHSHFPVCDGTLDKVLGMISVKKVFTHLKEGTQINFREGLATPLFIPDNLPALRVLKQFKEHGTHLAIVLDEYGSFEGIVTLNDFMEIITSELASPVEGDEQAIVQRPDGSWLVDGAIANDQIKDLLNVSTLYEEDRGEYQTLAGMLLSLTGRIPSISEVIEWEGFSFEIVDMDGNRIDRVLVRRNGA